MRSMGKKVYRQGAKVAKGRGGEELLGFGDWLLGERMKKQILHRSWNILFQSVLGADLWDKGPCLSNLVGDADSRRRINRRRRF